LLENATPKENSKNEEIEKRIRTNYLRMDETDFIDDLIFCDFGIISKFYMSF